MDQMPEDGSNEQQQTFEFDYRGLVDSIAYLSLSSRCDLAFPSHLLSRFLSHPGFAQWQASKHVLATSEAHLTWASPSRGTMIEG